MSWVTFCGDGHYRILPLGAEMLSLALAEKAYLLVEGEVIVTLERVWN